MELFALRCLMGLVMILALTEAYPFYRDEIPNGHSVSNPCPPFEIIHGVGHVNTNGGGPRNQFGLDFQAAGHRWTQSLCQKDSDNDGLSNGSELGDPDCLWVKGAIPTRTDTITSPGINNNQC